MNNGLFARFWKNILLLIFRDSRSKTTDYRLQLLRSAAKGYFLRSGKPEMRIISILHTYDE